LHGTGDAERHVELSDAEFQKKASTPKKPTSNNAMIKARRLACYLRDQVPTPTEQGGACSATRSVSLPLSLARARARSLSLSLSLTYAITLHTYRAWRATRCAPHFLSLSFSVPSSCTTIRSHRCASHTSSRCSLSPSALPLSLSLSVAGYPSPQTGSAGERGGNKFI
jgi:hypothetical protein